MDDEDGSMRPGELDRRITFQRRGQTQSPSGAIVPGWVDHVTVWAGFRPTMGRERVQAPQTLATRTGTWRIRWRSDITEDMRFLFRGQPWQIEGIAEIGRREGLEITATAIEGEG